MNTLCLSMIVKNEAHVLSRCLRSVRPLVASWVIVDTGSSDNTEDVARRALEGLPGEFVRRPWVDFSHNRNEALELSRRRADYSFVMDADDELELTPGFVLPPLSHDSYFIRARSLNVSYLRRLVLKSSVAFRYEGVVHEQVIASAPTTDALLEGVHYRVHYKEGARSADPNKYLHDAELLEEALRREPGRADYVYFLAQSYKDHGDLPRALQVYERRVQMGGDENQVFVALYHVAHLLARLGAPTDQVLAAHLRAHRFRPTRAETMCNLARALRMRGDWPMAHVFASAAVAIPRPANDGFLLDEEVYAGRALDEYALACAALGFGAEARAINERIVREAIAPNDVIQRAKGRLGLAVDGPIHTTCVAVPRRLESSIVCRR